MAWRFSRTFIGVSMHRCDTRVASVPSRCGTLTSYVVLPRSETAWRSLATRLPLRFVADPSAAVRRQWRVAPGDATLIVADRWGQVFFTID